jgi:hypothetical protein
MVTREDVIAFLADENTVRKATEEDKADYKREVTNELKKLLETYWVSVADDVPKFMTVVESLLVDVRYMDADWLDEDVAKYLWKIKCYEDTFNGKCRRIKSAIKQIIDQQQYM